MDENFDMNRDFYAGAQGGSGQQPPEPPCPDCTAPAGEPSAEPVGPEYSTYAASAPAPAPKKRKGAKMALLLAGVMVLGLGSGFGGGYLAVQLFGQSPSVIYQSVSQEGGSGSAGKVTGVVAQVAAAAKDSVVAVTVSTTVTNPFFGESTQQSAGSGVIVSADGYIVTNYHVVDGASGFSVKLSNGESYPATLVGGDEKTDLAVLKVEASGLTPAVWGDSDHLNVGDELVAIGNPLGTLSGTVTNGVVSALNREVTLESGEVMQLIQTNAAVNSGNSGGGLFNSAGQLIGIINSKYSGTSVEGLAFAIPINTAKEVVQQLMEHGYVTGRPGLNTSFLNITTREQALQYQVGQPGVYVYKTVETTGLKVGDYIVSMDGSAISTTQDIVSLLEKKAVGDKIAVELVRGGQKLSLFVEVQELSPASKQ